MTTFLLLLSLILNAAVIFAIILLYLRQNRLVEAEKKQERIINEIEEVFTAYLFELKEENDKFLEMMMNTSSNKQIAKKAENGPEKAELGMKKDSDEEIHKTMPLRTGKGVSYQAAKKAYQQNSEPSSSDKDFTQGNGTGTAPEEKKGDRKPLSLIDQVIEMKNQGLNIEEIARKLDKGKTEIELLLKFRQNKQE